MAVNQASTRWKMWSALALSSSILLSSVPSAYAQDSAAQAQAISEQALDEVRLLIGNYHVSGVSVKELENKSLEAIMEQLKDPYTQFIPKEELTGYQRSLEDQYVGIGVRVSEEAQGLYVTEVFPSSPALTAGLKEGDTIVSVGGTSAQGKPMEEVVAMIKGPEGSTVQIEVLTGEGQRKTLEVLRKAVGVPPVYGYLFSGGVGLIEVASFTSETDELFAAKLKELQEKGLKSLIIDLRYNPGGYLETTLNMAKLFQKEGVLMHERDRTRETVAKTFSGGQNFDAPVYILVNANSASASEVFTGMMQDAGIAKAVGTKTYGKGSVQGFFEITGGGQLKLTIEEYLTPNFRKVNHVGLTPDIEVEGDLLQLFTAMRLAGENSIQIVLQQRDDLINGQDYNVDFPTKEQDGKVLVPSRLLSAMVGAKIAWNGELAAVDMTVGSELKRFTKEMMINDNGTTYIPLETFQSQFPTFAWSKQDGKVVIEAK
ncbi:S41 family peptidase [Paenibacillus turpanensis]|uniref:S41 family peptidase n=1 Tax=Paenibacillus turpanensis TaxID=2689078 RepID=UPI001407F567|nr:S41 family peptidase [Paenibacillus turpanensis]